ncbi:hypothetical protein ACFSC6_07275 [Rufibacter sediminis]|uniref:Uncharacterized protein n=1 Tax=Rufibacter sediminis TaxID=2762756 RepID=A0ABR6VPC7_9BACT|nr:hypothetical protein [Rufibacter sediminis]MBC3539044.1 hypothetical protein [Rufibacter sediminis]
MTAQINGRAFTACTNLEGSKIPTPTLPKNNLEVTYDAGNGRLVIRGTDSCNDSIKSLHLDIWDVRGTGSYLLQQQSTLYYNLDNTPGSGAGSNGALQYLGRHPANTPGIFSTGPQHTGTFTVTAFDLGQRRFSANFELDVYSAFSGKVIQIREGRLNNVSF